MKKIINIYILVSVFMFAACTDDFENINTNPYQISGESLKQDFNSIGAYYPDMIYNLFQFQIQHNLINESYTRQLATPTPFINGVNNTTYSITWNNYWNETYNKVMAPGNQVIEIAEKEKNELFKSWARLIMITAASRMTAYYGPIIYTNYGSSDAVIKYDSEEVLYTTWFKELDEVLNVFEANKDSKLLAKFDGTYKGDVSKWIKFVNSLRLRLAMRLSKVAPEMAKEQGEKAIAQAGGLITSAADDFYVFLYGRRFRPSIICFDWNDTRMSATMESVLVGYKDNRITKYFDPVSDKALVPDHPEFPYKGIRNGAKLVAKDDHTSYSTINSSFKDATKRRLFTSCETYFLLAEASLRGWTGAGNAKTNYENGVKASFKEWGADGVESYLADDTSLPIDYNDIVYDGQDDGTINDFKSRIKCTIKWDESATNEEKLEKIMTQKWISGYMNTVETWVDHRRTDYPKLPFNYQNNSNEDWGIIPADGFLRRMPFVNSERENNPDGVKDATTKLGGPDLISTRLWWDVEGPNF